MQKNLNTRLKRRRRQGDPMDAYDRLPPELRQWLAQARLPWSAQSALRLWRKALIANEGDVPKAYGRLSQVEEATLRKDRMAQWSDGATLQ
jgi:hypothetical protein